MRLKCPNCGAEYDVAASMIPQGGRHVQCTACHTRWFVSPPQGPDPSEDRIIERLEAWSSRPRPVAVAEPAAALPPEVTEYGPGERRPDAADPDGDETFVWQNPVPEPEQGAAEDAEAGAPETEDGSGSGTGDAGAPLADTATMRPGIPQPRAVPEQQEAPVADPRAPDTPAPAAGRSASRLDLTVDPDAAPSLPAPQSRFAKGLAMALAAFVVALAVYSFQDIIVARVPAVAPAIEAYVQVVDDLRQSVADRIAGFVDAE